MRRPVLGGLLAVALLAPGAPAHAARIAGDQARLTTALRSLAAAHAAGASVPDRGRRLGLEVTPGQRVPVDVAVAGDPAPVAARLRALGMSIAATAPDAPRPLVEGLLPVAALDDAAALPGVRAITAIHAAGTDAGSVQSEGDAAHRGPQARSLGHDGAGVTVGIISDSIDQVAGTAGQTGSGIAASRSTGDLPSAVTVLKDETGGSDEGRAMAEIVYDEAPGVDRILFASGTGNGAQHGLGAANKADSIAQLVAAGAQVIADDIYMIDEPFFQDGAVAQAVDAAAAQGVAYFASAGNRARQSYEGATRFAGPPGANDLDDFDPGAGTDTVQTVGTVADGAGAGVALQWDEPWGGATSDLDVQLVNTATNAVLASSQDDNPAGTHNPAETVYWRNTTGATVSVGLRVNRYSGTTAPFVKWIAFGSWAGFAPEYATGSDAINPDAASAAGAITVAAVAAGDPGLDTTESFSSQGPKTRLFDTAGVRLASPDVRAKPDVAAADGVMTTVQGFRPFYGTSAATPSAAGVAALLLSAKPGLTPAAVRDAMTRPANVVACLLGPEACGAGFVRADDAVATVLALVLAPPTVDVVPTGATPNAAGWARGDVGVRFDVGGGALLVVKSGCAPVTLTVDGSTDLTCTATTLGGTTSRTVRLRRDATPPTPPVITGLPGGTLTAATLPAAGALGCTSSDATSGLASCTVSGYTTSVGAHTLTATATDVAGNTATATRDYVVAAPAAATTARRPRAADVVVLPSARICRRRPATLSIRLRATSAPAVASVKLAATGLRARTVRTVPARVRLRGLRRPRVVVTATVRFADGTRSVLRRTYRTSARCGSR